MRTPDLIIGPRDNPQTLRWHIFKWRGWQLALHKWMRSDDDRALHDHSGHNLSILLQGKYWEVLSHAWQSEGHPAHLRTRLRRPLIPYFRRAHVPHRILLHPNATTVWSLWLRWPPIREWGFHCPKGWRHWKDYLASRDNYYDAGESVTGPGCD